MSGINKPSLDGNSESKRPAEHKVLYTYDSAQWQILESEITILKSLMKIHSTKEFYNFKGTEDLSVRDRCLVDNLQLLAEQSLYEQYVKNQTANTKSVLSVDLSDTKFEMIFAKIQHEMGAIALDEALLTDSVLFPGVPTSVLIQVSQAFLVAADERMEAAGVKVVRNLVK